MGSSPQCRHKSRNQHGLPPIVEATVRLRATFRGYFQHVPRETCWSKSIWIFWLAVLWSQLLLRRCCLSDTRRNVFWCKGALAQMPSTREEIRFHMKERDPPGYHFGRAVGGAIPSVFGSFRGPCYPQVGPVSRTALISACAGKKRLGKLKWFIFGPVAPEIFLVVFFNATSAWTVAT